MDTLLLDRTTWDLAVDTAGNIARAEVPYARAQDAASAIKLFEGELYYNAAAGIPYFAEILGHSPPISLMKAYFVRAALTVPGVVKAECFITEWTDRVVRGQVQVSDSQGTVAVTGF